jgi:hypothetical protein
MMGRTAISEFVRNLDELGKRLIEHYMDNDYVPKVRTGLGRRNNFFYEHNSKKGVEIAKEIIKFKRMQLACGYLHISLKSNRKEKVQNSKTKGRNG